MEPSRNPVAHATHSKFRSLWGEEILDGGGGGGEEKALSLFRFHLFPFPQKHLILRLVACEQQTHFRSSLFGGREATTENASAVRRPTFRCWIADLRVPMELTVSCQMV